MVSVSGTAACQASYSESKPGALFPRSLSYENSQRLRLLIATDMYPGISIEN